MKCEHTDVGLVSSLTAGLGDRDGGACGGGLAAAAGEERELVSLPH